MKNNKIVKSIKENAKYLLFLIPALLYIYKRFKVTPLNPAQNSEEILSDSPLNSDIMSKIASDLANALGTAFSKFDPRSWTENDLVAFNLLKPLTSAEFNAIKMLYMNVYAKGNDLSSDLARLLDDKYYRQLIYK